MFCLLIVDVVLGCFVFVVTVKFACGLILRLVVLLLSFGLVGLLGWCGWWLICLFVLICGCFDAFA